MSNPLKVKKEVKGSALIELGANGSLAFENITVYMSDHSDKDLVMMIVDKDNPNHKIQLTFNKTSEFEEVKKPDDNVSTETQQDPH
jgi:hypothetical protein